MQMPTSLNFLKNYFVEHPQPLIGAKTIQILLAREIHDFSLLRTEDTRELNTAITPESTSSNNAILRVVFLGSKQKAPETRMARSLLDTAYSENDMNQEECYHKNNLCLNCPRCILFGAVQTQRGRGGPRQIKHRIIYNSAFSLLPYDLIEAPITFNAINQITQSTEQALGTKYTVTPSTFFPSIVELREVTWKEFVLYLKALMATTQYGAEGRIHGKMRNTVLGFTGGWESIITPLEYTLELYGRYVEEADFDPSIPTVEILRKYKKLAAFQNKVKILDNSETEQIMTTISEFEFSKDFLEQLNQDVENFRNRQSGG
jgi:CRISPR type I-D-associated protein Csc2